VLKNGLYIELWINETDCSLMEHIYTIVSIQTTSLN